MFSSPLYSKKQALPCVARYKKASLVAFLISLEDAFQSTTGIRTKSPVGMVISTDDDAVSLEHAWKRIANNDMIAILKRFFILIIFIVYR